MRKQIGRFMFSMGLILLLMAVMARIYGLNPASQVADTLSIGLSGLLTAIGIFEMRRSP